MAFAIGILTGIQLFMLIELRSLNKNLCEFARVGYRIEKLLKDRENLK